MRKIIKSKFKNIPLLVTYYLTKFDGVWKSGFWVIPKIRSANLSIPIHNVTFPLSFVLFESWKFGKEGKKLQKFEGLSFDGN